MMVRDTCGRPDRVTDDHDHDGNDDDGAVSLNFFSGQDTRIDSYLVMIIVQKQTRRGKQLMPEKVSDSRFWLDIVVDAADVVVEAWLA